MIAAADFVAAQSLPAAPKQGAELLKADILGVFAHPDDETSMAATLAYYALGRTCAVVNAYCTRGEGGGNMVGTQWGAALGLLREAELRACLAVLGVRDCHFLDRLDWAYTESATATLQRWGKEETLERLVRLVRALRPEIIVTMNPAPTPGQHGHHQAAGILATEAFAAAADPKRFPLQITKEGLSFWQTRKLYFSGGGTEWLVTIPVTTPMSDGRIPAQVAGQALANHRSQGFGRMAQAPWLQRPQQFTLVRSFIPLPAAEDDLLSGLPAASDPLTEVLFARPSIAAPIELEFVPRPALAAYRHWVHEQGIAHVATRFQADLPLVAGEPNTVTLQLLNRGPKEIDGELRMTSPEGWRIETERARVRAVVGITALEIRVTPPEGVNRDGDVSITLEHDGMQTAARATGHPVPRTQVRRIDKPPALDGSDRDWAIVPAIRIAATNLAQGRVTDDTDSSAKLRLAHDGTTLFVDVEVLDDVVVTNISPDDIKGHWRSDSVEICIDPAAGAEHTMGCYKLGIFPFDTTGVVRAARDADANQGPVEETAPRTRLVSRRTEGGYRIQAAIPFEEIGLLRGSKRAGFNLIVYDGDKRDAALGENINESRIAWSPRPGVMGRPEDWGRIDLEGINGP